MLMRKSGVVEIASVTLYRDRWGYHFLYLKLIDLVFQSRFDILVLFSVLKLSAIDYFCRGRCPSSGSSVWLTCPSSRDGILIYLVSCSVISKERTLRLALLDDAFSLYW